MSNANIETKICELIIRLQDYLAGRLSHDGIQNHVRQDFDDFDADLTWQAEPYFRGEPAYWCAIWTIQHLADEEHWKQDLPPRNLCVLIEVLKKRGELPVGWQGHRPK